METMRPAGTESKTVPSCASDSPRFSCTVGIREPQLEKQRPVRKNDPPMAARAAAGRVAMGRSRGKFSVSNLNVLLRRYRPRLCRELSGKVQDSTGSFVAPIEILIHRVSPNEDVHAKSGVWKEKHQSSSSQPSRRLPRVIVTQKFDDP